MRLFSRSLVQNYHLSALKYKAFSLSALSLLALAASPALGQEVPTETPDGVNTISYLYDEINGPYFLSDAYLNLWNRNADIRTGIGQVGAYIEGQNGQIASLTPNSPVTISSFDTGTNPSAVGFLALATGASVNGAINSPSALINIGSNVGTVSLLQGSSIGNVDTEFAAAALAIAIGADGGIGSKSAAYQQGTTGTTTGTGHGPGRSEIANRARIIVDSHNAGGIFALAVGGKGGDRGGVNPGNLPNGGASGTGGFGGEALAVNFGSVSVYRTTSAASSSFITNPGVIGLQNPSLLQDSFGIRARSQGGRGGEGGWNTSSSFTSRASGGYGGNAGLATARHASGVLSVVSTRGVGILAEAIGGAAGRTNIGSVDDQNLAGATFERTALGGGGGQGGIALAEVLAGASVQVAGLQATGVLAFSAGGRGGFVYKDGTGAFGGNGGNGNDATAINSGNVYVMTQNGAGIRALSIGGTGGYSEDPDGGEDDWNNNAAPGAGGSGGKAEVQNRGTLTVRGSDNYGVLVQSVGGGGGNGEDSNGFFFAQANRGESGGSGGDANYFDQASSRINVISSLNTDTAEGSQANIGVVVQSIGGGGGASGKAGGLIALGSSGGFGGTAGTAKAVHAGTLTSSGTGSVAGLLVQSIGGGGGLTKSSGGLIAIGGIAGQGGDAGTADVRTEATSVINTLGDNGFGALLQSIGGGGGRSDGSSGALSIGGSGGAGGNAGLAKADLEGRITTSGRYAYGALVQSIGGGGGSGGTSNGPLAIGGGGGAGGDGAAVEASLKGTIATSGEGAIGLIGQSIGGGGGSGGGGQSISPILAVAVGGAGAQGGDGGDVSGDMSGSVFTNGRFADGVVLQSVGGGGGNGGTSDATAVSLVASLAVSVGGNGGDGGDGGMVSLDAYSGSVETVGNDSRGLFLSSVGGGGGSGGAATAKTGEISTLISQIPRPSDLSVKFYDDRGNLVESAEHFLDKIVESLQAAASDVTVDVNVAIGGGGGDGGDGGAINFASQSGSVVTRGNKSVGLSLHSLGGGGGVGGTSTAVGVTETPGVAVNAAVSIGGFGGDGGKSGAIDFNSKTDVDTFGTSSGGVTLESAGGGGGSGGNAIAFSGATGGEGSVAASLAIGGSGGDGGDAGRIDAVNEGRIQTRGDFSAGFNALSIGGGGGSGGSAYSVSRASGSTFNVGAAISVGGKGGGGGDGGEVDLTNHDVIRTEGTKSNGIQIGSVGGGGGFGGEAFGLAETSLTHEGSINIDLGILVGGSGGDGGHGAAVTLNNLGMITTSNTFSTGILALSVGGGGGAGNHAVKLATQEDILRMTGNSDLSDSGSNSGSNKEEIKIPENAGLPSSAVQASLDLSVGGTGGGGGNGGTVDLTNSGTVMTSGLRAVGITASSIGGGGGEGGFGFATSVGLGPDPEEEEAEGEDTEAVDIDPMVIAEGADFSISVGGSGGGGGTGGRVTLTNSGSVTTTNKYGAAILAQSIGGGGGNAGSAVSDAVLGSYLQLGLSIGGSGGSGNSGGLVGVTNTGTITTTDNFGTGILAQSIGGGGGGAGGGSAKTSSSGYFGLGILVGGRGGTGNLGGQVSVINSGSISTRGIGASAISAQSIGGSGGGQASYDFGSFTFDTLTTKFGRGKDNTNDEESGVPSSAALAKGTFALGIAVGGSGGSGGYGGNVNVVTEASGVLLTTGIGADGITASSVGGGGGSAAIVGAAGVTSLEKLQAGFGLAIGGNGGDSQRGGDVSVTNRSTIITSGNFSQGINAQSVGGGGGTGRISSKALGFGGYANSYSSFGFSLSEDKKPNFAYNFGLAIGGKGGASGDGRTVTVTNEHTIQTSGVFSNGIQAMSIGGGGGSGGEVSSAGLLSADGLLFGAPTGFGIGGSGGAAGQGGDVMVVNNAGVTTLGAGSNGIAAQSIGGGGGYFNTASMALGFGLSGVDGAIGHGQVVDIRNTGTISTSGTGSMGILAQSIGGGGGFASGKERQGNKRQLSIGLALYEADLIQGTGSPTNRGDAERVVVRSSGSVTTRGNCSAAIFAQSSGGGGGYSSLVDDGACKTSVTEANLAETGKGTGAAGAIVVSVSGDIRTEGRFSHGIRAVSLGDMKNTESTYLQAFGTQSEDVLITTSGKVETRGDKASAIVAEILIKGSIDENKFRPSSKIKVQNEVIGGSGTDTAAVYLLGGESNEITVEEDGSIKSNGVIAIISEREALLDDLSEYERMVLSTGTSVSNQGEIRGSVRLSGEGENQVLNLAGGTLSATDVVLGGNLASKFTNQGVLNIGLDEDVSLLKIEGNFEQSATGNLLVDFHPTASRDRPSDRLVFDGGSVSLDGTLDVRVKSYGANPAPVLTYFDKTDPARPALDYGSLDLTSTNSMIEFSWVDLGDGEAGIRATTAVPAILNHATDTVNRENDDDLAHSPGEMQSFIDYVGKVAIDQVGETVDASDPELDNELGEILGLLATTSSDQALSSRLSTAIPVGPRENTHAMIQNSLRNNRDGYRMMSSQKDRNRLALALAATSAVRPQRGFQRPGAGYDPRLVRRPTAARRGNYPQRQAYPRGRAYPQRQYSRAYPQRQYPRAYPQRQYPRAYPQRQYPRAYPQRQAYPRAYPQRRTYQAPYGYNQRRGAARTGFAGTSFRENQLPSQGDLQFAAPGGAPFQLVSAFKYNQSKGSESDLVEGKATGYNASFGLVSQPFGGKDESYRFGLQAAYLSEKTEQSGTATESAAVVNNTVNQFRLNSIGEVSFEGSEIKVLLGGGYSKGEYSREIAAGETLAGEPSAIDGLVGAHLAYMPSFGLLKVGPSVALNGGLIYQQGYEETGGSLFNTTYGNGLLFYGSGEAAIEAEATFLNVTSGIALLKPQASAFARYTLLPAQEGEARLSNHAGSTHAYAFAQESSSLTFGGDLGVEASLDESMSTSLSISGELTDKVLRTELGASLSLGF